MSEPIMETSQLFVWGGFAVQVISAGALQLWPRHRWIGWFLLAFGWVVFVVASTRWYADRHPAVGFELLALVGAVGLPIVIVICNCPWHLLRGLVPFGTVSFNEAAQKAYEAVERTGMDSVATTTYPTPDTGLKHYKYMLLCSEPRSPLYGARPPSTQLRQIPFEEYPTLHPVDGDNSLSTLGPPNIKKYGSIMLRRRDMKRAIRQHIAALRSHRRY